MKSRNRSKGRPRHGYTRRANKLLHRLGITQDSVSPSKAKQPGSPARSMLASGLDLNSSVTKAQPPISLDLLVARPMGLLIIFLFFATIGVMVGSASGGRGGSKLQNKLDQVF